jgi:uncharacterized protein (TIGR03085 family)
MAEYLALRERIALCDLALALGPDAPTLCEGWDAQDLVAHLLVRERNPLSSLGSIVPPLAGLNARAMEHRKAKSFEVQVEKLRTPSPLLRALRPVDKLINTFEMVVHHEDLRRGEDGWEARDLAPADADLIWSQLSRGGAFFGRKLPVPTVLRRSDTGASATMRKGDDPVTVSGPVVELVLFLFGRSAIRDVTFEGPEDRVAALRAADLGA